MTDVLYNVIVRRVAPHRWRWFLNRADEEAWVSGDVYRDPGQAWGAAIAHLHRVSGAPASATAGARPVVMDRRTWRATVDGRTWQGSFTVPKEQP